MKYTYIVLTFFICFNCFSQENKKTNIFEFNSSTDKIIYRNHNNKKEISGFRILLGKKLKFFSANPYLNKEHLKINIDRIALAKVVENDNANKKYSYIIFLKSINKYFFVDHIVRKVECK